MSACWALPCAVTARCLRARTRSRRRGRWSIPSCASTIGPAFTGAAPGDRNKPTRCWDRAEGGTIRGAALEAMHFGSDPQEVERGRERLAFEELLLLQLALLARRAREDSGAAALALAQEPSLTERWLARGLPFALTGDQLAAIATLRAELAGERPTQRLLMGEVGSGKTVVALYAMLRAVEHGLQAALMAPTETLAEQHFATIQRLLGGESVTLALLTGSPP